PATTASATTVSFVPRDTNASQYLLDPLFPGTLPSVTGPKSVRVSPVQEFLTTAIPHCIIPDCLCLSSKPCSCWCPGPCSRQCTCARSPGSCPMACATPSTTPTCSRG